MAGVVGGDSIAGFGLSHAVRLTCACGKRASCSAIDPRRAIELDASDGSKQRPRLDAHQIRAKRVDGTLRQFFAEARSRLTAAHGRLRSRSASSCRYDEARSLTITRSTPRRFIRQYSCALSSWQDLSDVLDVDRCAAGRSAGRRKWRAATGRIANRRAANDRVRRCPETRIGVNDRCREALKVRGLLGLDVEMAKLDLGLRPREASWHDRRRCGHGGCR